MSYRIRKVRKSKDFSIIILLNEEIFPDDPLEITKETEGWIVYKNKQPVGFATVKKMEERMLYMDRGGIVKSHREKGLHKRLIRVRERFARSNNFKYIMTYTVNDNYKSLCSLIRSGYKLYDPEYEWAGESRDEVLYFMKTF